MISKKEYEKLIKEIKENIMGEKYDFDKFNESTNKIRTEYFNSEKSQFKKYISDIMKNYGMNEDMKKLFLEDNQDWDIQLLGNEIRKSNVEVCETYELTDSLSYEDYNFIPDILDNSFSNETYNYKDISRISSSVSKAVDDNYDNILNDVVEIIDNIKNK